jgi:hypothetical protein
VLDGAVHQALQSVQAGQANRGLLGAELLGGLGVQLGDASLSGVAVGVHQSQLGVALPTGGQQQRHRPTGADHQSPGGADRVELNRRPLPAVTAQQHKPNHYCNGEHTQCPHRDDPV